MTIEQLKQEVTQLAPGDREELARWLFESIDPLPAYEPDLLTELHRRASHAQAHPEAGSSLEDWRLKMKAKRSQWRCASPRPLISK